MAELESGTADAPRSYFYRRHCLATRITHWISALCLTVLMMSGLQIFNAFPMLYWGTSSYSGAPPLLVITAKRDEAGNLRGVTRVFGHEFDTTGWLGVSKNPNGELAQRGFPSWTTIPDLPWLAMARRWHSFFSWLFVINWIAYFIYSMYTHHIRDLIPTRQNLHLRTIGRSIKEHALLRRARGAEAKEYNVLQKIAYLAIIFGITPLIILMGFAMSPWLNSVFPGWVDLFGGRQAARTLHFVFAWTLVVFVVVHLFEVVITGLWNNMRSMITGHYRIDREPAHDTQ